FGAIRAYLGHRTNVIDERRAALLLLGALPMANVLAVGALMARRHPGNSPFLMGFEACGAVALAFFIALAIWCPGEIMLSYLTPVITPILQAIGVRQPLVEIFIVCFVALVLLGWPQVALALAGGFFCRRFKVTITRR